MLEEEYREFVREIDREHEEYKTQMKKTSSGRLIRKFLSNSRTRRIL